MNQTQAHTQTHSQGFSACEQRTEYFGDFFLRKPWLFKELLRRPEIIMNNSKFSIIVLIEKRREKQMSALISEQQLVRQHNF